MNIDLPVFSQPLISIVQQVEEKPKQKPKPKTVIVKKNQTLTDIARETHTSVLRLFYKNKGIKNPDDLKVGQRLVIPTKSEKLKKRSLPKPAIVKAESPRVSRQVTAVTPPTPARFSSSDNLFDYHSCTWWVKWNRPDIPNELGNAYEWVANAQRLGMATGSTPRVGAAAQQGNHVIFVIAVSGTRIYIGDGNYDWQGSYRERWANASDYYYIY